MLVVIFDSEERACQARRDLHDLHQEGSITLYADVIIAKDAEGTVHVRQGAAKGPIGIFVGMLVGGLIGLLAGPTGFAVGMTGGGAVGAIKDLHVWGVDLELLNEVRDLLAPGKTAIVAELTEGWTLPLDTKMRDGVIIRRPRADVVAEQSEREIEALKADFNAAKVELREAKDEARDAVMQRFEKTKQALVAAASKAEERLEIVESTANAKIDALKEQAERSRGDAKARCEARIAEVKQEYSERSAKLKQANELVREALTIAPPAARGAAELQSQTASPAAPLGS